eukprot:scaffold75497_cov33-Tisochrysis_lutea.AAC.3
MKCSASTARPYGKSSAARRGGMFSSWRYAHASSASRSTASGSSPLPPSSESGARRWCCRSKDLKRRAARLRACPMVAASAMSEPKSRGPVRNSRRACSAAAIALPKCPDPPRPGASAVVSALGNSCLRSAERIAAAILRRARWCSYALWVRCS